MSDQKTEKSPQHPEITYAFLKIPAQDQIHQILDLYRKAGWWSDSIDDAGLVAKIVSGSFLFAIAVFEAQVIGMGRVISDGASDAYIQDVTVAPAHQSRGIGSRLVRMLVERLKSLGIGWIGLIAEQNSHPFYTRLGFKAMSDSRPMLIEKNEASQKKRAYAEI